MFKGDGESCVYFHFLFLLSISFLFFVSSVGCSFNKMTNARDVARLQISTHWSVYRHIYIPYRVSFTPLIFYSTEDDGNVANTAQGAEGEDPRPKNKVRVCYFILFYSVL